MKQRYSPTVGNRMSWSFNSEDARAKRSEMVAGGSERPARMMGLGGSGGDSEDEVLMTTVSGEPCGDKGGGESLIMLSWGLATAFPFPLSTFGISFSSLKRGCDFSSLGAPSARLAAFFWISLNLCAKRSEIVALLTGLSRRTCGHSGRYSARTWRWNLMYTLTMRAWRETALTRLQPCLP